VCDVIVPANLRNKIYVHAKLGGKIAIVVCADPMSLPPWRLLPEQGRPASLHAWLRAGDGGTQKEKSGGRRGMFYTMYFLRLIQMSSSLFLFSEEPYSF
jgi:hypothetical protein